MSVYAKLGELHLPEEFELCNGKRNALKEVTQRGWTLELRESG